MKASHFGSTTSTPKSSTWTTIEWTRCCPYRSSPEISSQHHHDSIRRQSCHHGCARRGSLRSVEAEYIVRRAARIVSACFVARSALALSRHERRRENRRTFDQHFLVGVALVGLFPRPAVIRENEVQFPTELRAGSRVDARQLRCDGLRIEKVRTQSLRDRS